jgi:hypothetical protein
MMWTKIKFNILDGDSIVGTEDKLIMNSAVLPEESKQQWDATVDFYKHLGLDVKIIHVRRVI